MLKYALLALVFSARAFANDSGIVMLEVQGIAPYQNLSKQEVKLYGKDTKALADVLPVTDVVGGRSVHIVSAAWVASIYCQEEYERPTNGQTRRDWMCTLGIEPRAGSIIDNQDFDKAIADASSFTAFSGSTARQALGIAPAERNGYLFSAYGKNMELLATKLGENLTFSSSRYTVDFNCTQEYWIDSERKNDYMCTIDVNER